MRNIHARSGALPVAVSAVKRGEPSGFVFPIRKFMSPRTATVGNLKRSRTYSASTHACARGRWCE